MDAKAPNSNVPDAKVQPYVPDAPNADVPDAKVQPHAPNNIKNLHISIYQNRRSLPNSLYEKNYNHIRRSYAVALSSCLMMHKIYCDQTVKIKDKIVRKIERSCYNETCRQSTKKGITLNWKNQYFIKIYQLIMYKIQKNITGGTYLINGILNKSIDCDTVGKLKSNQLSPYKSKMIYAEIEKRKLQKIIKKFSSQYTCHKCNGTKTSVVEMQARALDEDSTLHITCEIDECSNDWFLTT
jgi:DNA-directed RNA polymerase subunit M/transcription elongation factor TFIIS